MNTKSLKLITILLFIFILIFNLNVFDTSTNTDEDSADTTVYDEATEQETSNSQYNPSYSNGSPYVTSVSSYSSASQANLSLNNFLSILLISIGILIIILAIAILIKLKKY